MKIEYVSRENRDVGLHFRIEAYLLRFKKIKKYLIYFEKSTKRYGPRQEVGLGLRLIAVIERVVAESAFLMNEREVRAVFAGNRKFVFQVIGPRNIFLFN